MEIAEVFRIIKQKTKDYYSKKLNENNEKKEVIKKLESVRSFGKFDFYKNQIKDKEFFENGKCVIKFLDGKIAEITHRESLTCGYFDGYIQVMEYAYKNNSRNKLAKTKVKLDDTIDPLLLIIERLTEGIDSSYDQERIRYNYLSDKGFVLPMPNMNKTITELALLVYNSDIPSSKLYNLVALAIKFNAKYYLNNKKALEKLSEEEQEQMKSCINLDKMFNIEGEVIACEDILLITSSLSVLFNTNIFSSEINKIRYKTTTSISEHFIAYYFGKLLKANNNKFKKEKSMQTSFLNKPPIIYKDKTASQKRSQALALLKEYYEDGKIKKSCDIETLRNILIDCNLPELEINKIIKLMKNYNKAQSALLTLEVLTTEEEKEIYSKALGIKNNCLVNNILYDLEIENELYLESDNANKVEIKMDVEKMIMELKEIMSPPKYQQLQKTNGINE